MMEVIKFLKVLEFQKMDKFYLFMLLMLITSCKSKEEYIVFELAKKKPRAITFCKVNTHRTDSIWALINKNPKECIEYLMTFKGHKEPITEYAKGKYGRIGFSDRRISYLTVCEMRNDVGALHLICAIYYNNYFFSSDRILYFSNKVIYDTHYNEYHKYPNDGDIVNLINNYKNSALEINEAWQLVELWWSKNKDKSIEEIRKGERPFGKSDLYWYGEAGGKANKNFPHKFIPCYDKTQP